MTHAVRGIGLAASLVLVSTAGAFAPQAKAQSTSAFVYVQVQGPAGAVYGYSASPTGQLTAIPGSPFKPGTQIVGSNKSQFFTLGKTTIHSYEVGSNGAIGSQLTDIGYLNFAGSSCGGGTNGLSNAVLDHTGQYLYVLLQNGGDGSCAAYQTYNVGSFTFQGDTEKSLAAGESDSVGLPSILGNESFGYANEWVGHYSDLVGFKRDSSGTLQVMPFTETDPTLSGSNYLPANPDASPDGNYVVVQLNPDNGGGDSNPPQLGSYTVDASGNLSTTNTSSNMPTTALEQPSSTFSPDGKLLFSWGGPGTDPGEYNIEHNITCDADGWVYVADRENHRIQVFDGSGRFETQWHGVHRPSGLYQSADSLCYVGEAGPTYDYNREAPNLGPRVSIWTARGALLARLGLTPAAGTEPGQFLSPHGIAVDSRGDIYVGEVAFTSWPIRFPELPRPQHLRALHKLTRVTS